MFLFVIHSKSQLKTGSISINIVTHKKTFHFLIKHFQITFEPEQLELKFKILLKARQTFVIIQKSQLRGSSLLDQKLDPIRKKIAKKMKKYGYFAGLLSQGLQVFRLRRLYLWKNFPQRIKSQNDMLWITVGLNQAFKSFFVNFG